MDNGEGKGEGSPEGKRDETGVGGCLTFSPAVQQGSVSGEGWDNSGTGGGTLSANQGFSVGSLWDCEQGRDILTPSSAYVPGVAIEGRIGALLPLKMGIKIIPSCLTQLLSTLIHACLHKAWKRSSKSYEKPSESSACALSSGASGLTQINLMIPQLALAAEAEGKSY